MNDHLDREKQRKVQKGHDECGNVQIKPAAILENKGVWLVLAGHVEFQLHQRNL